MRPRFGYSLGGGAIGFAVATAFHRTSDEANKQEERHVVCKYGCPSVPTHIKNAYIAAVNYQRRVPDWVGEHCKYSIYRTPPPI